MDQPRQYESAGPQPDAAISIDTSEVPADSSVSTHVYQSPPTPAYEHPGGVYTGLSHDYESAGPDRAASGTGGTDMMDTRI